MFRSKATDDSEYVVSVQGARARSTCSNISSILFRNYDKDSDKVYDMAKIAVRDHYGNSNQDGFGDIVFETKRDDTTDLKHSMSVINSGQVIIGDDCFSDTSDQAVHSLLTVRGAVDAQEMRLSSKDPTDSTYLSVALAPSSSNNNVYAVDFRGDVHATKFAVSEGVGRLFTISGDTRVFKLDPDGLVKLDEYDEHPSPVRAVFLYEGDGKGDTPYLYTSDLDKVHKIDARTMTKEGEYDDMDDVAWSLLVAPDGYLYAGLENGEVHKIDTSDMTRVTKRKVHDQRVTSLIYCAANDSIISGSFGASDTLHRISKDSLETQESTNTDGSIWALAADKNDDSYFYSGGDGQQVDKRSSSDLSIVASFEGHSSRIEGLYFGYDGFIYSCSLDETARKIDPSDMSEEAIYTGLKTRHLAIVVGSQGRVYVSGDGGKLHQLNATNMSFVASFDGHNAEIIGLAYGARVDRTSGDEAKPSITWKTDDDTGFYLADDDTLCVSTGGVERLRVGSNLVLSSVDVRAPRFFAQDKIAVGADEYGQCEPSSPSDPARLKVYGAADVHELRFSSSNCDDSSNFAVAIGGSNADVLDFRGDIAAAQFLIRNSEGEYLKAGGGPPIGTILFLSSDKEIDLGGLIPADGRNVSRTKYAELFEVIGEKFGAGDGATTFGVPSVRASQSVELDPVERDVNEVDYVYVGTASGRVYKLDPGDVSNGAVANTDFSFLSQSLTATHHESGVLFSGGSDGTLRKLDVDHNGDDEFGVLHSFSGGHDSSTQIWAVAVSEEYVFSGDGDGKIFRTSRSNLEQQGDPNTEHTNRVTALVIGADDLLYSGSFDNRIRQIEPTASNIDASLAVYDAPASVWTIAWGGSANAGYLYAGLDNGDVLKIDTRGGSLTLEDTYTGHGTRIEQLAWHERDGVLISASLDEEVHRIEVSDSDMVRTHKFTDYDTRIQVLTTTEDYVFFGGDDFSVRKLIASDLTQEGRVDLDAQVISIARTTTKTTESEAVSLKPFVRSSLGGATKDPNEDDDVGTTSWKAWDIVPDTPGIEDVDVEEARYSVRAGNVVELRLSLSFEVSEATVQEGSPAPEYLRLVLWTLPSSFEPEQDTAKVTFAMAFEKEAGSSDAHVTLETLYNRTVRVSQSKIAGKVIGSAYVDPASKKLAFEVDRFFPGKWRASGTCSYRT